MFLLELNAFDSRESVREGRRQMPKDKYGGVQMKYRFSLCVSFKFVFRIRKMSPRNNDFVLQINRTLNTCNKTIFKSGLLAEDL